MTYHVSCIDQLDPYSGPILAFIKQEFPNFLKPGDKDVLDILTDAIVGSGQVRFGPKPSPESLVAIREVITYKMELNEPIPFLVPWGSEKPDGSGIDVAELFAMKTLHCLNSRVKKYYAPGVVFNVRLEDVSAPHLFFDRMEQARADAALYTNGMLRLAQAIGVDSFVNLLPESRFVSEETFNRAADAVLPYLEQHVRNPLDTEVRAKLMDVGWMVPLTPETLAFYMERYAKLYPEKTVAERQHILARYFAGALTRYTLKITGVSPEWGRKYLELSLVQPTPGIGADRALRRLYYRTLPSSITSNHCPPWRCKGYLKVGADGNVATQLTSFNHMSHLNFNKNVINVGNGKVTQEVQADYIIEE